MEDKLKYAQKKLNEAIRQREPDETIAYWRGYRDCAKVLKKDHFPDTTEMVPLTLEQLRGMDGQPVLLEFDFELEPMIALVEYVKSDDCIILTNNLGGRSEFYSDEELKESGIKVYAYSPAHIDREAWEPCESCMTCDSCKKRG